MDSTNEEKDIADFAWKSDLFSGFENQKDLWDSTSFLRELPNRTNLYLEMMAAAFLKETGLKAVEVELVISYGVDKIVFSFKKRKDGNYRN